MARTNVIQDGDLVGHFDPDNSLLFQEDRYFDGSNMVSKATGSPFEHEYLYRTRGGRWVLQRTSNWEGVQDTYEFISSDHARTWLLRNEHDDAVEKHWGAIPEETGPDMG